MGTGATLDKPADAGGLIVPACLRRPVDERRDREIRATFRRIQAPLRWPLGQFRRARIARGGLDGYRFSRVSGDAMAGFFFGFALKPDALPGIRAPPEAVAYVFAEPVGSALHDALVRRRGSPVRRLVERGRGLGYPFEFHADQVAAAVRHRSVGRLPPELFVLVSSDFFMNTQTALRYRLPESIVKATQRKGP